MAWINNISTWTKPTVEGSIRMRNDRDQWRKYVHGLANPRIEDADELDSTELKWAILLTYLNGVVGRLTLIVQPNRSTTNCCVIRYLACLASIINTH